jgi:hypothetical protein
LAPFPVASIEISEDGGTLLTAAGGQVATWNIADDEGAPRAVAARVGCLPYVLVAGNLQTRPVGRCATGE